MKYTLDRSRADRYPKEKIIDELRRVAEAYDHRYFTRHEFDEKAEECKGSVVLSRFGSWQAALDAAGLKLEKVKKNRFQITNEQLFAELGRIWRLLGHRPSKDEWEALDSQYSYTTYKARFGGWINACSALIEYESALNENQEPEQATQPNLAPVSPITPSLDMDTKRNIPMKLRYKVLTRDKYRCIACGRSPATHIGVSLHVDHILPFSSGGKTEAENLQTLCNECNWGKGAEK